MALIFTYASFGVINRKVGFGFAIWLNIGYWVCVGSLDGSKVSSPKEADAQAILIALKEASSCRLHKIHLVSDALQVIQATNGSPDWSIQPIFLLDITDLSVGFDAVTLHLPRRLNGTARIYQRNDELKLV